MYKLLYSSLLLLGVATATKKNVMSKNKNMEYIISDKKGKGHHRILQETKDFGMNGLKYGILSEEEANELRNHGYNVEENKKVHQSVLHKKTVNKGQRHLQQMPSNTNEVVAWGRDFVLEDSSFFDNLMANTEPANPVKVCIASSGIDIDHEDLPKGRIIGMNMPNVTETWDEDPSGHGTHAAGIIAAVGNNNKGVKGIIDNDFGGKFELVIGKLADSPGGNGTVKTTMDAIDYCIEMGANVVAITVGSYCDTDEEREYFEYITKYNDTLVFSTSGNKGDTSKFYPASYPSVVSVAGVDHNGVDIIHHQSDKNDQIELAAPGTDIFSTTPDSAYETWSGSANAVAYVAGVAGILRGLFPNCKNHQIRAAMLATARQKSGMNGCNSMFGHGVVQAKAAYDLLNQTDCGGDIGEVDSVGGCQQLKNPILDSDCTQDSDCDDNDACTVDTCNGGTCTYTHDCPGCGLTEAVKVDIKTDIYSTETSWEVLDGVTDKLLWKNKFEYSNCMEYYSHTKCFDEGSYLFVVYDEGYDGMCCCYGDGGYNVTVGDNLQVSGGEFKQVRATMFHVGAASAKPSMTSSPATSPTTTNQPTGTWNPTVLPTNTMVPSSNTCASDADCDDGDSCTVDTCDSESKCTHVADCDLEGCGYKELITIDINTDNHPAETKWVVTDYKYNQTILWRSPAYTDANSAYSSSKCFPIGLYVFTIRDDADDGMCCDYGIGNYTASVNTKVYGKGSAFQDMDAHLLFVRETSVPSSSPSDVPSTSPSDVPSDVPSSSPSDLPSNVPSSSPSDVPSTSPSDVPSDVPSSSPSDLPSNVPSSSPSDVPSTSPSDVPSDVPSSSPSDVPSTSPSDVPSSSPSDVPSTSPSAMPSDVPSSSPSDIPSTSPSDVPSSSPSDMPSDTPSSSPSDVPSTSPSALPSEIPSSSPSDVPSTSPSDVPSSSPSDIPSTSPSDVPSDEPSFLPSDVPSDEPSSSPSDVPSSSPSDVPSDEPSSSPSDVPSDVPSSSPSDVPSDVPSSSPSDEPSSSPSDVPSDEPSSSPSDVPSYVPSYSPSDEPSSSPSDQPSDQPSTSPSLSCALDGEGCGIDGSAINKKCCNYVPKTLTCNLQTNKCEKFCANSGVPAQECTAPDRDHIPQNCCSGLECEKAHDDNLYTRLCVPSETNVCARTDVTATSTELVKSNFTLGYAVGCGAILSPNTKCCPKTACDFSEETNPNKQFMKRCVDCASVGEKAAQCDPDNYVFPSPSYDFEVEGMPKICCPGLDCNPTTKECKNTDCAADSKNARSCGATYANKAECCENHTCVGKSCVRNELLPCGKKNTFSKECGLTWAVYFHCCPGLECETNPAGHPPRCVEIEI